MKYHNFRLLTNAGEAGFCGCSIQHPGTRRADRKRHMTIIILLFHISHNKRTCERTIRIAQAIEN